MRQQQERDLLVYPRYLRTWRQSRARAEMTLEQRGLYWDLLDHCWQFGSLPADIHSLQTIAMCKTSREFSRAWKVVRNWFVEKDGRFTHKKVDVERPAILNQMQRRVEQHSQAGKNRAHSAVRNRNGRFSHSSEPSSDRSSEHPARVHQRSSGESSDTSSEHLSSVPANAGQNGAKPSSEHPASVQLHARDKHTRTTRTERAGPSGQSARSPISVGSSPAAQKNREKKKSAKRATAPRSGGKAPARRSPNAQPDIPAPVAPRVARIVGLHGTSCEVELNGRNGTEIRSMPISEAEQLLALANGVAQ